MRRVLLQLAALAASAGIALAAPSSALAHGFGGGRADLPISKTLFIYAAALVLILSFVALAVLWPKPKLAGYRFVALPAVISRVLLSPRSRSSAAQPGCSCLAWCSTPA